MICANCAMASVEGRRAPKPAIARWIGWWLAFAPRALSPLGRKPTRFPGHGWEALTMRSALLPTPLYISKQRKLAIFDEDLEKLYVIEITPVIASPARSRKKPRGENMKVS